MRHGHTGANEKRIFCGRLDPPLSPRGEAEVRSTAQALGSDFDRLLTSDARRAKQSIQLVCPDVPPETLSELREIDFGEFEGRSAQELEREMPQHWAQYIADPLRFVFPGGDDAAQYLRDAAQAAHDIAQSAQGRVLVVSHKGFIMTALSALLHGDASHMLHYDIRPAGFAALHVMDGFAVLTRLE